MDMPEGTGYVNGFPSKLGSGKGRNMTTKETRRKAVTDFISYWIDADEDSQSLGQLLIDPDFKHLREMIETIRPYGHSTTWNRAVNESIRIANVAEEEWRAEMGIEDSEVKTPYDVTSTSRRQLTLLFKYAVWTAAFNMTIE